MWKHWITAFAVGMCTMILCSPSHAETLLGTNYAGGFFDVVMLHGDTLERDLGTGYGAGFAGNINTGRNIDWNLSAVYSWADGEIDGRQTEISGVAATAILVLYAAPDASASPNPFLHVGPVIVKRDEDRVSSGGDIVRSSTLRTGFSVGGGMELELTEQVLFRIGIAHQRLRADNSTGVSSSVGFWFNGHILATAGGFLDLQSEDRVAEVGLILK